MQELLKEVLARHKPRVLFAYLFGSTGTRLEHQRSDLDLAVYFQAQPGEITLEHKLDLYTALSRALQRNQIDIVVLNTCRNYMLLYQIL
ncbi:MAG: nucleotidyltransferase domain-containing protein, partial [Thermodesulfobacteriota bacterium]